jgi:hypothetical protein
MDSFNHVKHGSSWWVTRMGEMWFLDQAIVLTPVFGTEYFAVRFPEVDALHRFCVEPMNVKSRGRHTRNLNFQQAAKQ